jgi:predicted transcriptional regulator of viral defense system
MKLDSFFALHQIFTINELTNWLSKISTVNHSTLHNSLAYHQKQGHIIRIRRGLYYSIPKGMVASTYPIDSFLVASKMAEDAVLGYRTALDLHGKLHSTSSKFIYLSKTRVMTSFSFKDIEYQAVSVPTALKVSNNEQFGIQSIDRLGQGFLVTNLERTLVDVLDRPNLCGSWEEIWRSLESIEYLNLEKVLEYAFLLGNATTIAKVGFFLETHRQTLLVPGEMLEKLQQHRPKKPHYLERYYQGPQKMISTWNIIIPLHLLNRQWEEPNEDI